MKVEVQQKDFLQAVSLAEKVSGKSLTLPVLNCVLLEVKQGSCIVRATNLDLGIEIRVPGTVHEEGVVAVPGATLVGVLGAVSRKQPVVLELDNDHLKVSVSENVSLIKSYSHEDFPTLPHIDSESYTFKASDLVQGIRSVSYSASTSTVKPELSSIYMYAEGGSLYFVATDSFRLAEKKVPIKMDGFQPILVPIRNTQSILRALEGTEGAVEVRANTNQLSISFDNVYLTSRLVDGSFPDYKQIIPKNFVTEVTILREDLLASLKKTALFSDKFNQLGLQASLKKKNITLSSSNTDVGQTTETVSANIDGEDISINFNQKYLTDCFQSIQSDNVLLSLSGVGKPMVITGTSDSSFLYLVMPMNK